MDREQIAASLRLILQEFEAGTLDAINVVTVNTDGEPSTLSWAGDRRLELLGAMKLSADYCSKLFGTPDKYRILTPVRGTDD